MTRLFFQDNKIALSGGMETDGEDQQFWYFQLRCLPSAIHSMAWVILLSRVFGRLASAIHSMYSRLQLGLKAAKTAAAFLLALSACVSSAGVSSEGAGVLTTLLRAAMGLVYSPRSMKPAARRSRSSICLLEGRSFTLAMRPSEPMPPSCTMLASCRRAPIS